MEITLILFVKNEIDGLQKVFPRINRADFTEIIAIDGKSTDGSVEFLKNKKVKVYTQDADGVREALWLGFSKIKTEYVMLFSPDNNSDPKEIPKLINKCKQGYDLVIASRYFNGSKSEDDTFGSMIGNKYFTNLINFLFRTKFTDALNIYKIFRTNLIKDLDITRKSVGSDYIDLTINWRAGIKKIKIAEVPTIEHERVVGGKVSRAHPGILGKFKSSFVFHRSIIRDFFFYK
jgi:glycosyltransferase involved in cell wall biosynthesis